ncbi:barstar family protein [Nocardia sp. NPDC127579]|uniref:barstar family protein n=1 Tax=Nocardia sp. NPDC127579 TaxID=3345402 RepID=UPI0036453F3C
MTWALYGDDEDEFWGSATAGRGLFTEWPWSDLSGAALLLTDSDRLVDLIGMAPRGAFAESVTRIGTRRAVAGNAWLRLMDAAGDSVLGSYYVTGLTPVRVSPSEAGPGLVDLTVRLCTDARVDAEPVWELVAAGLESTGMWRRFDHGAWLSVALNHRCHRPDVPPDDPPGATYVVDMSGVNDEDSFYCALGEAVNGPGGYFGWNLDAVVDCLRGNWGATAPFTLELRDADPILWQRRKFGILLEIFAEHGVDIRSIP